MAVNEGTPSLPPSVPSSAAGDEVGLLSEVGDEATLPSDVGSEADLPLSKDKQRQAPKGNNNTPTSTCSCNRNCNSAFPSYFVEASRALWQQKSQEDRSAALLVEVRQQALANDDQEAEVAKRVHWTFRGVRVCLKFWSHVHYVGTETVGEMKKLVEQGHSTVPAKLPKMAKGALKLAIADAWFLQLYNSISEPLANEPDHDDGHTELVQFEEVADSNHPLWNLTVGVTVDGKVKRLARKNYLNPGGFESLWALHSAEPVQDQVSKSRLYEAWLTWKKFMPHRNEGQGKRCRECALLDAEYAQATEAHEKQALAERKQRHVDEIAADRTVNVRGNLLSEKSAKKPSKDGVEQVLKITIDGMDQAKFRCPRNLANSADVR